MLCERLEHLMQHSCKQIDARRPRRACSGWQLVRSFLAYHFTRRYPSLGLAGCRGTCRACCRRSPTGCGLLARQGKE